ncbi:RadC family protein [Roseibacillus ishigakijimensis]|uniref:DNA repair protein RadC n=1 Tax=Roseibacillus ishigakijimensis TaxID=454146 RepID=A0A934RQ59_9BACT|nr:DNA repair protein RadC [Roseibacillus ishigakijimensis]MBK1834908.1 DNA repair protein RadC [Roseibacillus ishigakijimensis]
MKSGKLIHDLPEGEKPREKLLRLGPGALGDDELLAIFLRTGVPGENAIAIGRRLLDNHGGLPGLARTETPILAKEHGLGPAKACQLSAAFELGVRLARRTIDRVELNSPELIYRHMAPQMQNLRTESLRVVVLDSRLRCQAVHEVSTGSSNQTVAIVRDVLRPVLLNQAVQFAVVHNHPSGDPTPSRADVQFTRNLKEASELLELSLTDHVIIGQPSSQFAPYYSFVENDLI